MASQPRKKLWLLISVSLAVWVILSFAIYFAWIHGADHRDFYPWWAASRLHLLTGATFTTRLPRMRCIDAVRAQTSQLIEINRRFLSRLFGRFTFSLLVYQ